MMTYTNQDPAEQAILTTDNELLGPSHTLRPGE